MGCQSILRYTVRSFWSAWKKSDQPWTFPPWLCMNGDPKQWHFEISIHMILHFQGSWLLQFKNMLKQLLELSLVWTWLLSACQHGFLQQWEDSSSEWVWKKWLYTVGTGHDWHIGRNDQSFCWWFWFQAHCKESLCGLPKISFAGGIMQQLYSYGQLVQYLILHGYPSASSCGI